MPLDALKSVDNIETMENYLEKVRPPLELRSKIDIGYDIDDQSIILNEIRPAWDNPAVIRNFGYAKATFVKAKNIWKVFWKRADGNWHSYKPAPSVERLADFLKLVEEDKHACFQR